AVRATKGSGYGVTSLVLDPARSGTIYVGSDHAGLWKSTDCGSTWTKLNTGRNGTILDGGLLWTVAIDPLDPTVIYLSAFNSGDGGTTWEKLPIGGSNDASYRTSDGYLYGGSDYGINYVSPDGHTWKKIDGSPNGFAVVGDGTRLFTAVRFPQGDQPYFTAM